MAGSFDYEKVQIRADLVSGHAIRIDRSPLGVIIPMVFKGSGRFQEAADLNSPAGRVILIATALMLVGVVFVALAGFGRDKILKKKDERSGGFFGGLVMCVISGICSVGAAALMAYASTIV